MEKRIKIVKDEWITWAVQVTENKHGQVIVEFYDTRYDHTDLGQFVASYTLKSLTERRFEGGLILDGGVSDWRVHPLGMVRIEKWLHQIAYELGI